MYTAKRYLYEAEEAGYGDAETYGIWGGLLSLPECALDDDPRTVASTRFGVEAEIREALP